MSEHTTARSWFGRLIAAPATDIYEAQMGRLFNIALLSGLGLVVSATIAIAALLNQALGVIPDWVWGIPLFSVAGTLVLFVITKRGQYRIAASLYIGIVFVALIFSIIFFDGPNSPAWLVMLWLLMVTAVFISPRLALWLLFLPVILWGLLQLGAWSGMYRPLLTTEPSRLVGLTPVLALIVMLVAVPMAAVSARYRREVLVSLEQAQAGLIEHGKTLETEVARRTQEARFQAEEFRAVADLGRITASILDLDIMLTTAVELIAERFGYYEVIIFLLDEERTWLVARAAASEAGRALLAQGLRLQMGQQGVVGYVAATGVPYIALDVLADVHYYGVTELTMTRSEMAAPLELRGQMLGVLDVQSTEVGAFSERDLHLLRTMADSLAVAVQNALRFERAQRALEQFSRLQDQQVLHVWRAMLERHSGRMAYLYDRVRVMPLNHSEQLAEANAPLEELTVSRRDDGVYLLLVPLEVRGQRVGRFVFESDAPWQEDGIQVVKAVILQLGLALENARLLQETQRRAALQEMTAAVTARIREEVDIEAILERALGELGQALSAEQASVRLVMTTEEKE